MRKMVSLIPEKMEVVNTRKIVPLMLMTASLSFLLLATATAGLFELSIYSSEL